MSCREGDYLGTTVNVAARLVEEAELPASHNGRSEKPNRNDPGRRVRAAREALSPWTRRRPRAVRRRESHHGRTAPPTNRSGMPHGSRDRGSCRDTLVPRRGTRLLLAGVPPALRCGARALRTAGIAALRRRAHCAVARGLPFTLGRTKQGGGMPFGR